MALNILVVDDSSLVRKAIKHVIEMIELDVNEIHEAENGLEALDVLNSESIDLVLSD